jgi:hypothetical protein
LRHVRARINDSPIELEDPGRARLLHASALPLRRRMARRAGALGMARDDLPDSEAGQSIHIDG